MADEIKENEELTEGYTEFGGSSQRQQAYFYPDGLLGRFFAKFFATKAQAKVVQTLEAPSKAGDAVVVEDPLKPSEGPGQRGWGKTASSPIVTQHEQNKKERYKEFEVMDEYPEVAAAYDTYADDTTQKNLRSERWQIKHENQMIVEEVKYLFDTIKLDRFYWDICRNTYKYGDCYIELVVDLNNPKRGIQRIKVLNPNYILRVENEYGYLTDFLQEIPNKNEWDAYGMQALHMANKSFITLDKNQIVHFRLHTSDPMYYPYGKSIAASARTVFRSLKLMEDAMLIYRLARAPERRIFYIDTGNLPATKAEMFMERIKEKFKKEKYYHSSKGNIDSRYNPMSADEDFFVPVRGKSQGTKIETLPGAQNLGEVEDVRYFRDKLLAILKVPKDYVVEKDKSPERKANLSQLDVKFARVILRGQQCVEVGLESMAKRHLKLKGFPESEIKKLRVDLPDPSDTILKRRLDADEQKSRVVQAVLGTGLFSIDQIYKDYYDMSDSEIEEVIEKIKEEQQTHPRYQQQDPMGMGGEGGMGGEAMAPPPGEPAFGGGDPLGATGGVSPPEEGPPMESSSNKELFKKLISESTDPETTSRLTKLLVKDNKKLKE
tara:strand:- start:2040 stop:3854 length:1815 start_codon:yes stop_codon:yes gene_type:complete